LAKVSTPVSGAAIGDIQPGQVSMVRIAGAEVVADRWDWAGVCGLELRVPAAGAGDVYDAISTPWSARKPDAPAAPSTELARRIGWHALNIARIEAGTPLYMLDFGPDSLPHECGDAVLNDRVSFKKGCYLGQEIVARMQSLGHPKQKLVALRLTPPAPGMEGANKEPQAVTGTPIVEADAPGAGVVGAVTSSCLSPMLGQAPIALAMVKHSHTRAGQKLWAQLDGGRLEATVQDGMRFV
jgi:folate-binding protein YgfZ